MKSYTEILAGHGFGLEENRSAIETVSAIRSAHVSNKYDAHPLVDGVKK